MGPPSPINPVASFILAHSRVVSPLSDPRKHALAAPDTVVAHTASQIQVCGASDASEPCCSETRSGTRVKTTHLLAERAPEIG